MATDKAIDSNVIVLYDRWPGQASVVGDLPADGITNSTDHNVVAATRRYGEKVVVYNMGTAGIAGYATFIYLQVGTQNADSAIMAKSLCVPDSASLWYQLTNDPDDCINLPSGRMAYAVTNMTDAYYGWFWTGGVCPEAVCPSLGGTYTTSGTVVFGSIMAADGNSDIIVMAALLADCSCMAGGQAQSADA